MDFEFRFQAILIFFGFLIVWNILDFVYDSFIANVGFHFNPVFNIGMPALIATVFVLLDYYVDKNRFE